MNLEARQEKMSGRKVSVVVPSYNHEKFILKALNSVVRQTYKDYEIVLLDDASSDCSVERIDEFIAAHPEIPCRRYVHAQNKGGVITLNELIQHAQGEYIALINSDDIWDDNKLELQVHYLDQHPEVGAVFTQAVFVDNNDQLLTDTVGFPSHLFKQRNRSRGQWLRRLFYELNCFCHPSILIRKSVYDEIGLYDPRLRQLPDFQMWIRLIKQREIHIIEKPLVQLRIHKANTSKITVETISRNLNEMTYIFTEFFDGIPDDVLIDGFGDHFRNPNATTPNELACEKAFLYFTPDFVFKSLYSHIGLQKLFALLAKPEINEVLAQQYKFDYDAFFALNGVKFLDELLLSPSFLFARPPGVKDLEDLQPSSFTLRYFVAMNRRFIGLYLRRYPAIFHPMAKLWSIVRTRFH